MSPFKRLTEAGGQDPWLEATAERVRAGDPWAAVSPERAAAVGEAALERVRSERLPRANPRRLVLVVAALASSFALAALGRQLVQPPAPVPAVPAARPAPRVAAPPPPAITSAPEVVAPPAPPAPAPAKRVIRRAVVAPAAPRPQETSDGLDAEAQLLLTALRQLKIDGDPDAALATLDAHSARFPDGALKTEAEAARLEARQLKARRTTP